MKAEPVGALVCVSVNEADLWGGEGTVRLEGAALFMSGITSLKDMRLEQLLLPGIFVGSMDEPSPSEVVIIAVLRQSQNLIRFAGRLEAIDRVRFSR